MLRILAGLIVFCVFCLREPVSAQETGVPLDLQAKLFLSALTYDKSLLRDSDGVLTVGILYVAGAARSEKKAQSFRAILERYKDKKVSGLVLKTVMCGCAEVDAFRRSIKQDAFDVVYMAPGMKPLVRRLSMVTRTEKVFTFTSEIEYVAEGGLSMAVGVENNKPKLYLNLDAARAEGADFNSRLLRIVRIVGKSDR